MKRIGIITIYDEDNYGNRLQNYAVQETLKKMGFDVETIKYNYVYYICISLFVLKATYKYPSMLCNIMDGYYL